MCILGLIAVHCCFLAFFEVVVREACDYLSEEKQKQKAMGSVFPVLMSTVYNKIVTKGESMEQWRISYTEVQILF